MLLGWVVGRFLIDFWSIWGSKIDQKSIKNQSTNHPNNTTTKNWKTLKNHWFFNVFSYFGHVCCGKKSIKMVPTSFQEQLSNQHPNLDRFWSQLGAILGGFGRPRWGQVGTKSFQKSIFKSIIKMITLRIALGPQLDPPKHNFCRHIGDLFALDGILEPRWCQDPSKSLPGADFEWFWIRTW